jgi:hypothetical protein
MKKQINKTIKAHLLRSGFYLLLLVTLSAIPFALAQRNVTKGNGGDASANRFRPQRSGVPAPGAQAAKQLWHQSPTVANAPAGLVCSDYTTTVGKGAIVPGDTDTGNHCDDCTTNITFPFPISLYGISYTNGNISSNGDLQFDSNNFGFGSYCPYPNQFFGATIFPYQDDLRTDAQPDCSVFTSGCGVFTSVTGTAPNREFNIEWRTAYFGRPGTANFEIRFYENDPTFFDIFYGSTVDNGLDEGSGVQASASGPATTFSCGEATLTDGLKVTYSCVAGPTPTPTPTPPTPTPTPPTPTPTPPTPTPTPPTPTPTPPTPTPTPTPPTPTPSPTSSPTPTPVPSGCVRSQGYWKNHPDAWPVTSLMLGNVTYDQQQLLDILHQPVRGNGLLILAHQEIAAKLNIANGADGSCIAQTLADADALIGDLVVPPVGDGYLRPRDASPLAEVLDQYNEGMLCAPSCENASPTPTPSLRRPGRPMPLPRPTP